MEVENKKVKYKENLYLKGHIATSGKSINEWAQIIGINRTDVSRTINGHKKGVNIVPALEKALGINRVGS